MKPYLKCAKLKVKKSPIHGWGVFAEEAIQPNQVVEECHLLTAGASDPNFFNYYFGADDKTMILLGYGSMYNHSDQPNVRHFYDEKNSIFVFTANHFIQKGNELFISYGDNWFSTRQTQPKQLSRWYRIRKFISSFQFIFRFAIVLTALILLLKINIPSILRTL